MDQVVVLDGRDHEQGEVDATRDVAAENGVAHVPAPHWQALGGTLLQLAASHDRPPGVAREDQPAGVHLIIEIGVYCPSLPEAPMMQTLSLAGSRACP